MLTLPRTATGVSNPYRHIELDIDIGADAKDWSAVQATEKLKPVETELRRMEEMVAEIVAEMDYLRSREQKLRDTNESTNNRVKWFAFGTMGMLVALGAWQVIYLRAYFRYVDPRFWIIEGRLLTTMVQIKASYLDVCRQQVGIFYGKVRCVISGCRIRRVYCATRTTRRSVFSGNMVCGHQRLYEAIRDFRIGDWKRDGDQTKVHDQHSNVCRAFDSETYLGKA